MANELEVIIKATDQASKQVNTVSKSLNKSEKQIKKTSKAAGGMTASFKKLGAMFAGGAAIWGAVRFAKSSMEAFGKQEQAVIKLNQALKNSNQFTIEMSESLQKAASDIQRVTTVGDEDTLAMMQMGLSMGISADSMEKASRQAIGLSKAYGVDLNSSIKMVALAHQGEFTMLNRYIPQLRALETQTEKAALMDSLLVKGFGIAEAETRTYTGQVMQLKNEFGDLQEMIGKELLPVAKTWMGWIDTAITKSAAYIGTSENLTIAQAGLKDTTEELSKAYKEQEKNSIITIFQSKKERDELLATIEMLKKRAIAGRDLIQKEKANLEALREKKDEDSEDEDAKNAEKLEKDIANAEAIIERARYTQEELSQIRTDDLADRLDKGQEGAKADELREALTTINKKKEAKKRASNFASTMGIISSLSESGSAEIAAIGKAASISSALRDTYAAANKALASAFPPVNFVLAGIVTAMGLANVSKIAAFAEGGTVFKPTLAMIGERGPERITKMAGAEALGAGAVGGATVININITGEFLEGDETKWSNLTRDHIVPQLEVFLEKTGKVFS